VPPTPTRPIDPKAVEVAQRHAFDASTERRARKLLASICDPTRLSILRALRRTPLAASDLAHVLGRTRSATSQHLRVLREADAVLAERHGNVIRYRFGEGASADVLAEVCAAFDRLVA
jgi:DNA-binding transcriptional ArsR family regulator